ncbi:hypothetical protein [Moorena sp. SIO3E8]|nr:hypothetical protein [Moorena sp. SIO3E8]
MSIRRETGIRRGTGILPVSIPRQNADPTDINSLIQPCHWSD